jgi:hypothetical protein
MTHSTVRSLAASIAALGLALGVVNAQGGRGGQQGPPAPQGPMAPEKYKDIQVLTDVPAAQVDVTMQYFVASTGIQCQGCHSRDQATGELNYAAESRGKNTAREMINLVKTVNAGEFGARINCGTCHGGRNQPAGLPLARMMTPDEIAAEAAREAALAARQGGAGRGGAPQGGAPGAPPQRGGAQGAAAQGNAQGAAGQRGGAQGRGQQPPPPAVDDVLAKYVAAIGGEAALMKVQSRVMTGTLTSRNSKSMAFTIEEKGDKYRESVASTPDAKTLGYDGSSGWMQTGTNVSDLSGFPLQQVQRNANLTLPLHLKDRFATVQAGRPTRLPAATPGGTPISVNLIQATQPDNYLTVQFYFDAESGLLLRMRSITRTGLNGSLVEQYDYSDYKAVNGVKMPYEITRTNWNTLDTLKVSNIKVNTAIDDAKFAKPKG